MAHFDFYFTRSTHESGDWDVDVRMPSNVLNSLIEYTPLKVDPVERIVALSDVKMLQVSFGHLAGQQLVQFTAVERKNFERYVRGGGFVFVDDCNHDIDGLFAKSFEAQMAAIFGPEALRKIPNDHRLTDRSSSSTAARPRRRLNSTAGATISCTTTSRALSSTAASPCVYSNKDYGCEWDYDFRNKRWLAIDNTRFAINLVMYALGG